MPTCLVTTANTELAEPVPKPDMQLILVAVVHDVVRQVEEPRKAEAVKSRFPKFSPPKVSGSPPEVGPL